jgi:hypothetical protein
MYSVRKYGLTAELSGGLYTTASKVVDCLERALKRSLLEDTIPLRRAPEPGLFNLEKRRKVMIR